MGSLKESAYFQEPMGNLCCVMFPLPTGLQFAGMSAGGIWLLKILGKLYNSKENTLLTPLMGLIGFSSPHYKYLQIRLAADSVN